MGELLLIQEIGRTADNSRHFRKNRETWTIWDFYLFFHFFVIAIFLLYTKSIWNTEAKSSQIETLKSWTKKLNHLGQIKWHRKCKSLTFWLKKCYCSTTFCGSLWKKITFLKEFPLSSMTNSKSLSVDVFSLLNMLQKSIFCHGIS